MSKKRNFTIIGGGQSGLQLGCGLLAAGHDVHVVQNRTADDIRTGKVLSSQCMFDMALQNERDLGLNYWDDVCPTVDSINFCVPAPDGSGNKAIDWNGKLDKPGQSVDQRVKVPAWMAEFEKRGGRLTIHDAGIEDLETYARESDLVIVASGKGEIGRMFERDAASTSSSRPTRPQAPATSWCSRAFPAARWIAGRT